MNSTLRILTARLVIGALVLCLVPSTLLATGTNARLEGLVIDPDGRRSSGSTVYLFDAEGTTIGQSVVDSDGLYSMQEIPAGEYGMGIQTAEGVVAPVASPPIRLSGGELARRDLKLLEADQGTVDQALTANYGFGSWFGGLGAGAKSGVIIAFVALGVLIYSAFDEDETPASPTGNPSSSLASF